MHASTYGLIYQFVASFCLSYFGGGGLAAKSCPTLCDLMDRLLCSLLN